MTSHPDDKSPAAWIAQGAAIGLAGGLAEVLVVGAYAHLADVDAATVAGAIATAVHVDPGSAAIGVAVHMTLSALLGIALLGAARASRTLREGSASTAGAAALVALAAIWAVNFLGVLPWLSPGFVHLLPYRVTLASKLMFAVAATAAWRVDARPTRPCFRAPLVEGSRPFPVRCPWPLRAPTKASSDAVPPPTSPASGRRPVI